MTDIRIIPKAFLTEFIEIYKSLPCLWKVKSPEYSNKIKKNVAYEKLVEKWKEIEPEANRDLVCRKINSLRTSYRKEKKKLKESEKSGAGTDEINQPTLWYYELFQFIDDQETPRASISNFEIQDEILDVEEGSNSAAETPSSSRNSVASNRGQKRKKEDLDDLIVAVGNRLAQPKPDENECDIFGRNVASKLKAIPNDQRIFLEKIINDAIFEAQLGNLNRNCYIYVPPPLPTHSPSGLLSYYSPHGSASHSPYRSPNNPN